MIGQIFFYSYSLITIFFNEKLILIFMVTIYPDFPELSTCQNHFKKNMQLSLFSLIYLFFLNFLNLRYHFQNNILKNLYYRKKIPTNGNSFVCVAHL